MQNKTKNIIITIGFVVIIIAIFLINLITKDEQISITERRKLATFPKLSIETFIKGDFSDGFENYSMDQFTYRDKFRQAKTFVELELLGKKDINNLYVYNNMLIKQEYPLNEKSVLNLAKKINQIEQKYLNETNKKYYSIIP